MISKLAFLFLIYISLTKSFQLREEKLSMVPTLPVQEESPKRLDLGDSLKKEKMLSPDKFDNKINNYSFTEVNENDIPEGALVYAIDEPLDKPADGEILETSDNIVFRPLFRYRSKQEAQRRNSNRIRRRYFMPRRSYREIYRLPYPQRYYYL